MVANISKRKKKFSECASSSSDVLFSILPSCRFAIFFFFQSNQKQDCIALLYSAFLRDIEAENNLALNIYISCSAKKRHQWIAPLKRR